MELYKKYRPKTLKRVYGQAEAVKTLSGFIAHNKIPHAILFTGPSGCGKTTLARIMKGHVNCGDFWEMNSADFRGIDTIRQVRRQLGFLPMDGKSKVYLLDEVHKLSNDSQNAILKILEDTPDHAYFFLATTDPQKLLKTVRNRCTEIKLEPASQEDAINLLKYVLKREKKEIKKEVLLRIIQNSGASMRKSLVLLDQIINLPEGEQENALSTTQDVEQQCIELCRALINRKPWGNVADILKGLKDDPEAIRHMVLGYARAVLLSGRKQANAYLVIEAFRDNFFDSKHAGLAAACYEALQR